VDSTTTLVAVAAVLTAAVCATTVRMPAPQAPARRDPGTAGQRPAPRAPHHAAGLAGARP
jgi:hypothetical protein